MSLRFHSPASLFTQHLDILAEKLQAGYKIDLVELGVAIQNRDLTAYAGNSVYQSPSGDKDVCEATLKNGKRCTKECSLGYRFCKKHDVQRPKTPAIGEDEEDYKTPIPMCSVKTKKGVLCSFRGVDGGKCRRHARMVTVEAEDQPAANICVADTKKGGRCKLRAVQGSEKCKRHQGEEQPEETKEGDVLPRICGVNTAKGTPCKNRAVSGQDTCKRHAKALSSQEEAKMELCSAKTKKDKPCRNKAVSGGRCKRHANVNAEVDLWININE